jgi:hypothetical protein
MRYVALKKVVNVCVWLYCVVVFLLLSLDNKNLSRKPVRFVENITVHEIYFRFPTSSFFFRNSFPSDKY